MKYRAVAASLRAVALGIAALAAVSSGCHTGPYHRGVETRRVISRRAPLGPTDVFAVRVFGEQDLSGEYRVAEDGTIDYPYVGRVRAAGLEAPELAALLRRELRERRVLREPHVSVSVTHFNSRRVSVFGQVQRPGTLDFVAGMDVVAAISGAGGFTALANRGAVRVVRRTERGAARTFVIHVEAIADGRAQNFDLEPGDIVFVPEAMV